MNYSEKPWQAQYPAGVSKEVVPDTYVHLAEMLHAASNKFATQVAFENMGKALNYAEVAYYSRHFAAYLQQELGLKAGDRIAVQLPNLLQYPIILLGALQAGLVVVNTNPLYTAEEMRHQFADAEVAAVVILENFADKLQAVLKVGLPRQPKIILTRIGDMHTPFKAALIQFVLRYIKRMIPKYVLPGSIFFRKALHIGARCAFQPPELQKNDLAFLQYTGGTTGTPKGAALSHGNILANIAQIVPWFSHHLQPGKETVITALPLYHIFALTCNFLTMFHLGCQNILITNPRDMKSFLRRLSQTPFGLITGVNTLYNGMMNHAYFKKINFSALKISVAGGMALQASVAERWEKHTGCPIIEGYGLSETSPVLSINPLDGHHKQGSIGLPVSGTDLRLLDDNDQEVPLGDIGEICVRGPQVMRYYWQKKEETKAAFVEGYFRTGDLATMDPAGFLHIIDRKKEMINISGLKAYPNQIEEVIAAHPQVQEVGVRGLPDPETGEAVHAFIIKKDATLRAEEIRRFCKEKLTSYKIPKHIHFRESLPKSNVGKILRRHLNP